MSECGEPEGHDDVDDDPPFDVVQAVSDFVETVIDEVDAEHPEPPDSGHPDGAGG